MRQKSTILHVITTLGDGGAEANLYRLCVNDPDNKHVVVSLLEAGKYGPLCMQAGIQTHTLCIAGDSISQIKTRYLMGIMRAVKPDIVQCWMYHGCLAGSIAAKCTRVAPVVWGIHHAKLDRHGLKPLTFVLMKLLGVISRCSSDAIVYCAKSAALEHRKHGYRTSRQRVIPNGYDLSVFTPSSQYRQGDQHRAFRLGMVARWHPIKDHVNLLRALQRVAQDGGDFQLVLAGTGMHGDNPEVRALLSEFRLERRVEMYGAVDCVPDLMRSLDLHILSSKGEGFPNVLAEAMACGIPCVTTDVGDAADLVGDTGWVVPPEDPIALAGAIQSALSERDSEKWRMRCEAARKRIKVNFSLERMVEGYNAVWREVLPTGP